MCDYYHGVKCTAYYGMPVVIRWRLYFVGSNFRGMNEKETFVGFEIRGNSSFLHTSYKKNYFFEGT